MPTEPPETTLETPAENARPREKFRITGHMFPDPRPGCSHHQMMLVFDLTNERFLLGQFIEESFEGLGERRI